MSTSNFFNLVGTSGVVVLLLLLAALVLILWDLRRVIKREARISVRLERRNQKQRF